MERQIYHVVHEDNAWKVKGEGAERSSANFDNKDLAVERAKELAKAHSLGQVIIHKEDGSIQTEHTYGKDPHDIPG